MIYFFTLKFNSLFLYFRRCRSYLLTCNTRTGFLAQSSFLQLGVDTH